MNEFERFYAALGEMIVRWNQAESEMKALLLNLVGLDTKAAWILVTELGSVSLEQALKSVAQDLAPPHLQSHIRGLVDWFSRLREYRNYYAHGIQTQVVGGGQGILAQVTAKNGLIYHGGTVSSNELEAITLKIIDFTAFAKHVGHHAFAAIHSSEDPDSPPPRSLEEMPPLPDRLQKPRRAF